MARELFTEFDEFSQGFIAELVKAISLEEITHSPSSHNS
jgi:hypothetical protein